MFHLVSKVFIKMVKIVYNVPINVNHVIVLMIVKVALMDIFYKATNAFNVPILV